MASRARITQAIFKIGEIARLVNCAPDQADRLYRLYTRRRSTVARDIDLNAALGALVIAAGERIGIPFETVALHVGPLVNHGLFYLASETMPWPVQGSPDEDSQFHKSMEVDGFLGVRRIQELLNIQERPASRFLVWKGGKEALLTNDLNSVVAAATEPALAVLDVIAIANSVWKSRSDPLFTVEFSPRA